MLTRILLTAGFAVALQLALFFPAFAGQVERLSPAVASSQEVNTLTPTLVITAPLLIDSQAGRLYSSGQVGDGPPQTLALAADGRLLATFDLTGPLGLDPAAGRLYVDQDAAGLAVIDTGTGAVEGVVALPGKQNSWDEQNPAPQADPATGQVLAFRDNLVYVIDPARGEVVDTLLIQPSVSPGDCRLPGSQLPIERAWYDPGASLLYLGFLTYVCTPWYGYTLLAYDLANRTEIEQVGLNPFWAVTAEGGLYGQSWHRFGIGDRWIWTAGRPGPGSTDWSGMLTGLVVDAGRERVLEPHAGSLRIFNSRTMVLEAVVPMPVVGELAGYDPRTDQLYFLAEGRLAPWPASRIRLPNPQPPVPGRPPAQPVSRVLLAPGWPQEQTVAAIWASRQPEGECYVFDQFGGQLFLSEDGGHTWALPQAGLPGECAYVTALALSPDYTQDHTLLAGLSGYGLFKSTDGGALWQPRNAGLPSMGIRELLMSPAFAVDQTVFVRLHTGGLFRSTDGGESWQALEVELAPLALSPEFDQDGTLLGSVTIYERQGPRQELRLSRDAGATWQPAGEPPPAVRFTLLSLAPLFARWQVAFGYGDNGVLYRSADGGVTWQAVLNTTPPTFAVPQLVYAPEIEENRPLFLLVPVADSSSPTPGGGMLYRSGDGGQNWQPAVLPPGLTPTAVAISPNFARDGLLFLGTADGRVVSLAATELADK